MAAEDTAGLAPASSEPS